MQQLEKVIYAVLVFTLLVAGFTLAANAIIDDLPEHQPVTTISCAYRENCHVQVFQVDEGRKAYCAIWANGRQSKCAVDPKRTTEQSEIFATGSDTRR